LTDFENNPILAPRSQEDSMQAQTKSLAIAVTLTVFDIAVFHQYFGVIWQVWARNPWAEAALLILLSIWIASAAVLWIQVSRDLRHSLRERAFVLSRNPGLDPSDIGENNNV
jgi:hypothetical protein